MYFQDFSELLLARLHGDGSQVVVGVAPVALTTDDGVFHVVGCDKW